MRLSRRPDVALILLVTILVPAILSASPRSRSKKKTKDSREKEVNICDIEEQGSPLYCYCDSQLLRNATNANCWIFGNLEPNVSIWTHFSSQPYLEKLTFTMRRGGNFSYIPSSVLAELKNIEVISVQYATIGNLMERAFSNISTIVEINLSRNSIVNLTRYAFENMKNLTLLNLDENRIGEINRDVFVSLPSLKKLYVNKNNLTVVHDKAFKHLVYLQELELNGNQLSVITRETFYGLRNLVRLDLRGNRLGMIGDRTFMEMPQLEEMDLDQNQIEFIADKGLMGMRNLRKLRLSENKLVTLEPDFLTGAPNLHLLDLRDNQLKTMTFDNIKPIVTNLYSNTSHFYLEGNRLSCDCRLAWIWGLRNETKNTRLQESLEELTCFLEANDETNKSTEAMERESQALAIELPLNEEEFADDDMVDDLENADEYPQGDEADDYYDADYEEELEDGGSNTNTQTTIQIVDGKAGFVKHLFQLRPEELPCPDRAELMASEQPASHLESTFVGSASGSVFALSSSEINGISPLAFFILTFTNIAIMFT